MASRSLMVLFVLALGAVLLLGCGSGGDGDNPLGSDPTSTQGPTQVIVQPSTASQTIQAGDLLVTIPGGLLTAPTTLSVTPKAASSVASAPSARWGTLGAYEVTLGTMATFSQPLTIEFPYQATDVNANLAEGEGFNVSYFDEQYKKWRPVSYVADTARKRLVVTTDHLSLWIVLNYPFYFSKASPAGRFKIYFDYANTSTDLIDQVGKVLDDAYAKYQALNLTIPSTTIEVVVDDFQDSEANSGYLNEFLYLAKKELGTSTKMKAECAHELFHLIQFRYDSFWTLWATLYWFAEGTPDFAVLSIFPEARADIVKPQDNEFLYTYFQNPWYQNEQKHAYCLLFFLDYLKTQRKLDVALKSLWEDVHKGLGNTTKFMDYVEGLDCNPFHQVWNEYVNFTFLSASSPLHLRTEEPAPESITFTTKSLEPTVNAFSAAVYHFKSGASPATLTVSLAGALADQTAVTVVHRKSFSNAGLFPDSTIMQYELTGPVTVSLNAKECLTILVKNNSTSTRTFKIRLEKPSILPRIQQCNHIAVMGFDAVRQFKSRYESGTTEWRDTDFDIGGNKHKFPSGTTATWSGSSFSIKAATTSSGVTTTWSITGTIDDVKKTIASAHCEYSAVGGPTGLDGKYGNAEYVWIFDLTDIPLDGTDDGTQTTFHFSAEGSVLQSRLTMGKCALWNPGAVDSYGDLVDTDWTGTVPDVQSITTMYKPSIFITFRKL